MAPVCAQKRFKWGGPTFPQRSSILLRSFSATGPLQGPQMEPKWSQHGAKMEPKRHQKINVFLDRFLEASGNIDGIARGLRRGCEGAATGLRVSHFLQPTPQGGAILSKIIVQKQAKRIACGIWHASSRWLGELFLEQILSPA